jgi:hypothetical protein
MTAIETGTGPDTESRPDAGTSGAGTTDAGELLAAGAVLPIDTSDTAGAEHEGAVGAAGEQAVPLTARAYRHPALDDRVVVRLVAAELGAAEDLAAGFLGLERDGEPEVVGLGQRASLGFPEWVLVHHPADGHHALGVVPELERLARQAKTKPKAAFDGYQELAGRLAAAVPHFLPTFYEQAGRVFLSVENPTYASQLFSRARRAEAEFGLPLDENRLDAVFLEFALSGALPVRTLSVYAKELAARVPAGEALRRFTRLCLRRTAGGLPPSAQMAKDLRRLARAAGEDAAEAERAYLAEVLTLPATLRAPAGWWKDHHAALVELAGRRPEVRSALLNVMPQGYDEQLPAIWLELLESCGATAGLCDPAEEARPEDGAAGWLERFLAMRSAGWREPERLPALYDLVERAAGRLRAELTGRGASLAAPNDLDLLDLLLAQGVPVAGPGKHDWLRLSTWAKGEGQRDLRAVEADPRFRSAFRRGANRFHNNGEGLRAMRTLMASPGGRPMLTEWVREVVDRSAAAGLPELPDALTRLTRLPGDVLALAEDAVRQAAAGDLAPILVRTLRAGLFDELSWPAWEEAASTLVARKDVDDLLIADAWPHLIVAGPHQARVIGAGGTVLTHDLRIPAGDVWGDPGYHYVDGELLVHWRSRQAGRDMTGYWHTAADRPQPMQGVSTHSMRMNWYSGNHEPTLPLPGGGRTTGHAPLHLGDTVLPGLRPVISDGTSTWVWLAGGQKEGDSGWREFDPATGAHGRPAQPGFFTDATREAPAGTTFLHGWLAPGRTGGPTPAGADVDGLIGWRVTRLPDGSLRGEDLTGRAVTVPDGSPHPEAAVTFPGDDLPRAVVYQPYQVSLVDPDGVVTSVARADNLPGAFAAGTTILPPVRYWHCLRPRDVEGSLALRRIDRETAAALLKAAAGDDLPAAVRALLPQVSDEALLAGVAGVVRYAAAQQARLDAVAERLERALSGHLPEDGPAGPADKLLHDALNGLHVTGNTWWHGSEEDTAVFAQLRAIGRALRGGPPVTGDGAAPRLHIDGPSLPWGRISLAPVLDAGAAICLRAAGLATTAGHRAALCELLGRFDEFGIADTGRWRRFDLHLDSAALTRPDGRGRHGGTLGTLPLEDGAFLAVVGCQSAGSGWDYTALFHDPAGRFEVPAPYQVRSSGPAGQQQDGAWLAAFLAELAERGPAPWFPEAAEEFARLTGVSPTMARLVVAGLPGIDTHTRTFLTPEARATLGVKQADAAVAKDELSRLGSATRTAVVAALLPAEPARLWTHGPRAAAAAEVWNRKVGRRTAVPEALIAEAARVRTGWEASRCLSALLSPATAPQLSRDIAWTVRGDRAVPERKDAVGFTSSTLTSGIAMAAWLAHRLPAGDPLRAALPAALTAIRERLAAPGLMLDLNRYVSLPAFRKVAGAPTETAEGYERYGAVIMATHDQQPSPAIRTALLDAAGTDPFLPALRGKEQTPFPVEVALRAAHDERFAALLGDPGAPAAGEPGEDGTWWPQDPSRSVPDVVAEVAGRHGLGADAAVLYLMLLAMPDPTDRNTARWSGFKPARIKAARAELAATDLVFEASRSRAGRKLFLPGGWTDTGSPRVPLEEWKVPLYGLVSGGSAPLGVVAPAEPVADIYRKAWQRVLDGDAPRYAQLKVGARRGRRR